MNPNRIRLFTPVQNLALATCLSLSACGGGGEAGSPSPTPAAPPPPTTPASASASARAFTDIRATTNFSWSTVANAPNAGLTLRRTSGAAGTARVVLSNFIEVDPTGSGEAIDPMSTDVIATAIMAAGNTSTSTVTFSDLRLPAATTDVLVEVFDIMGSERLTWSKVKVSALSNGSIELSY